MKEGLVRKFVEKLDYSYNYKTANIQDIQGLDALSEDEKFDLQKELDRELQRVKEKEDLTAEKYLLQLGLDPSHLPEIFNDDDKSYYTIAELMENYYLNKK